MLKAFKTEIDPTPEQAEIIRKTIGVCRFIYNFYIAHNQKVYASGGKFVSGMTFSKWLNNEYIPGNPEYSWIKEVSSKSVKKSIMNAETAMKRFFKGQASFPRFKKKGKNEPKIYFVKTDAKAVIWCERHRIKIPTLGWVRIKEKGYIPTTKSGSVIKSGTVSIKAGRYYVSVLAEVPEEEKPKLRDEGVGVDVGIKDLAITSDGNTYKNINKTKTLKKLERKLKREQRRLSRKLEVCRKQGIKKQDINKKGGAARTNIEKQKQKVQRLHQRITNIRTDYINKTVSAIVKTKPGYITIEDLNVSGMMKNRHLSKALASQKLNEFRAKLTAKCEINGIELRLADRWYPSSKKCHKCGNIKKDLKLSDRVYKCECGYEADRDYNASLNLLDAEIYRIA